MSLKQTEIRQEFKVKFSCILNCFSSLESYPCNSKFFALRHAKMCLKN